ncbi:MAG: SDR family oxidoreductase [Aestuariivita sp.]|nr:SDR family oxidoreductase [Aestuariivita sp.]
MNLGIAGKRALVCASSKGLGLGCALALAEAGVNLVMNARNAEILELSANSIRKRFDVIVNTIATDITTENGQEKIAETLSQIDILVTNAGGPPAGQWQDWSRDDFISAIDANMLAPIQMMQKTLPFMMERRWGRIINITSQSVKAPIAQLGLSNTARTGLTGFVAGVARQANKRVFLLKIRIFGLTGFVAGVARQVAPSGVTINNLLPGIHATDRAVSLDVLAAKTDCITKEDARKRRENSIPVRRYGTIEEFGAACAFLCSEYAGFIIGQNILLDGGGVNSTL